MVSSFLACSSIAILLKENHIRLGLAVFSASSGGSLTITLSPPLSTAALDLAILAMVVVDTTHVAIVYVAALIGNSISVLLCDGRGRDIPTWKNERGR